MLLPSEINIIFSEFFFLKNDYCWRLNRLSYDMKLWKKSDVISHEPVKMGEHEWKDHLPKWELITNNAILFFCVLFSFSFGSRIHIYYKLILGRLRMNENIFLESRRTQAAVRWKSRHAMCDVHSARPRKNRPRVQAFSEKIKEWVRTDVVRVRA